MHWLMHDHLCQCTCHKNHPHVSCAKPRIIIEIVSDLNLGRIYSENPARAAPLPEWPDASMPISGHRSSYLTVWYHAPTQILPHVFLLWLPHGMPYTRVWKNMHINWLSIYFSFPRGSGRIRGRICLYFFITTFLSLSLTHSWLPLDFQPPSSYAHGCCSFLLGFLCNT